jgi:hypothetical protein
MKNIYIPILLVLILNACVKQEDICEYPKITGDFIVKESYPEQDSVRISTKNIRINNKTITEFKNLAQINPKDIFELNLYNISNSNYYLSNPQYIINDTSINFKITSGQYRLDYPYSRSSFGCFNFYNYNSTKYAINILAPIPKTKCRISKIVINNSNSNGFTQGWDPSDGPDTYVDIITDGAVALSLKKSVVNNVQLNMLPLTFNLDAPFEIGNSINNVFKNLEIVIMDDDTPNTDQPMGSALFNANLQLLTNSLPSVTLRTINDAFSITLYFYYVD